jgi:DNA-binding CsgD family transcriptional regulator
MSRQKSFSDIAKLLSEISARQQQVVTLVCDGLSNRKIAEKLGVTEGAVKIHLHAIFEKLGVRARIELISRLSIIGELGAAMWTTELVPRCWRNLRQKRPHTARQHSEYRLWGDHYESAID